MSTLQDKSTLLLSVSFRVVTYLFLRWFPGHQFPIAIYSLFALYLPSFIASYLTQNPYSVLDTTTATATATATGTKVVDRPSATAQTRNLRSKDKPTQHIEEVRVEKTVVGTPQSTKFWRTLLTGSPSPTSSPLSLITLLINAALLAGVADFVYRAPLYYPSNDLSFARIGYVGFDNAKLVIREPDSTKLPIAVSVHLKDPVAPFDNPRPLYSGGVKYLTADTDYTVVVPLEWQSQPREREYIWKTSNNHSGTFTTPPKPGKPTARNDGRYTFLTTSCIIPHFPYNPFDHPLSIPGFSYLAKNIPSLGAQFMLFLGDFIYIDVPRRFGTDIETYRRHYRQVYASPEWASVSQNLSWIHVLDDHEIANDWSGNTTGVYSAAVDPYRIYQTDANPPAARKAGALDVLRKAATYFEFMEGPAAFFMLDTRSYRSPKSLPINSTEKTMLGQEQLSDLLDFLRRPVPKGVRWKFLASSVPFTKNWRFDGEDTWGGYLAERRIILEAMWDLQASGNGVGVVIVSGDRHEFAATAFPPPKDSRWPVSATVHEFSTSPLNQFYVPVRTYWQTDEEDMLIKYIPKGNSKFAAISIENPESAEQSVLKFRLFVDGKEKWQHVLLSPVVALDGTSGGGGVKTAGQRLKGVLKGLAGGSA